MISGGADFNPWRAGAFLVPSLRFSSPSCDAAALRLQIRRQLADALLPIIAIFLWTIYRPDLLPPLAVLVARPPYGSPDRWPDGRRRARLSRGLHDHAQQRLYWTTLPGSGVLVGFIFVAFAGS